MKKINLLNPDIICLQEIFTKNNAGKIISLLKKSGYLDFYYTKNLLAVSRYKILDRGYKIFKEQGKLLSYSILDVLYKKAFQYFSLKTDRKILIINAHLLSAAGKQNYHYKKSREKQILEILSNIKKNSIKRVIILGDFNFVQNSEPYKLIMENGFVDASRNIKEVTFPRKKIKIDYIFVKGIREDNLRIKIIKMNPLSDHNALYLYFSE